MDFSGMGRSVQDVGSDSHAHSNAIFNENGTSSNHGIIPNATMKF